MTEKDLPAPGMIGLVATDLDGTLLRSDGTISSFTGDVLKAVASRVPLVLVTARPPRTARLFAKQLGLDGRLICCNGALVYDTLSDSVVLHSPMAAEDARLLVEAVRAALPEACFAVELGLRYGFEPQYRALGLRDDVLTELAVIGDALDLCSEPVTKLIVRHPHYDAATLAETLRETFGAAFAATYSASAFVEVAGGGVNKASALAAMCSELGINREAVLAFGDMPNDLPMLLWAGHAVAVANADPQVIEAIGARTTSNDEDGVARYLADVLELGNAIA